MERIYFDNGSTSWPKAPKVAESMAELLTNGAFNINRGNYEGAYEVAGIVLETREQLKRLFHAADSSYLFPELLYSGILKERGSCNRDRNRAQCSDAPSSPDGETGRDV